MEFEDGKLSLIRLQLESNAPVLRKTIIDIALEHPNFDFRIVALHRNFEQSSLSAKINFSRMTRSLSSLPQGMELVLKLAGKEKSDLNNIMILGGRKIGRRVAKLLKIR